jgi:hypothetical protein
MIRRFLLSRLALFLILIAAMCAACREGRLVGRGTARQASEGAPGAVQIQDAAGGGSRKLPAGQSHRAAAAESRRRALHQGAFQPLHKPSVPVAHDGGWGRTAIDRFVFSHIQSSGVPPPADREAWLRRVTFDLIGLPPTTAEADAFLADKDDEAFVDVVDRLLASPHYGERWGRHWLDLVRYAETQGHEVDEDIPGARMYRDYVVRAFNADLPYDRFVVEQIAGDLLSQPRRHPIDGSNESVIGTGFFALGEVTPSPVDVRAEQASRLENVIEVFGKAFLGLTLNCARCHDHKFDPISMNDYYALAAYFVGMRPDDAPIDDTRDNARTIAAIKALDVDHASLAVRRTSERLLPKVGSLADYLLSTRFRGPRAEAARSLEAKLRDPHEQRLAALFYPWRMIAGLERGSDERFAPASSGIANRLKAGRESVLAWRSTATVFARFDKKTFDRWRQSGDAFSSPTPAAAALLQSNAASPIARISLPNTADSGMASRSPRGVLRSPTFTLESPHIWYLAAGSGSRIDLIIDGYRRLEPPLYDRLRIALECGSSPRWHGVDVGRWLGERAYIEVVDDGPGYAALSEVVFNDGTPPAEAPNKLLCDAFFDDKVTSMDALARAYQGVFTDAVNVLGSGRLGEDANGIAYAELLNWLLANEDLFSNERAMPGPTTVLTDAVLGSTMALRGELERAIRGSRRALAVTEGSARKRAEFTFGATAIR